MDRPLRFFVVAVIAAVVAATAATAVLVFMAPVRARPVAPGPTPVVPVNPPKGGDSIIPGQPADVLSSMQILPFDLVDQDGEPIDETIFDGRVTIVDFFFTRCPGPCPLMTSELRRIQSELAGTGVRIVSFSVDAGHDSPEVLRQYAASTGADLDTWTFVTGDEARIAALAIEGLGFALEKVEASADATSDGPNILHPTHFVLVDPDGKVRALAGLGNREHIDLLVAGARGLASGAKGG